MRLRIAGRALVLGSASALTLGACSADKTTEASKPAAPLIVAVSDLYLQGTVDHEVAPRPTVRVTNEAGNPLSGVSVLFFAGDNLIPPVTTGPDGLASVTWRLSRIAGTQTLTARVYSPAIMPRPEDITFTAIALPDTLMAIRPFTIATQVGLPEEPAPTAPAVAAVDEYSNPKPGVEVTFEVTGGGSVTPGSAVTDADGRASIRTWTLGADVGVDTVIARVGNLDPVYFTARVVAPFTATSIVVGYQNACAVATSGDAYCWGTNVDGEVNAHDPAPDFAVPQRVALPAKALTLAAGYSHNCAIVDMAPPQAYCWGANSSGQLGSTADGVRSGPLRVPVPDGLVAVTAGAAHSCGLTPAGVAYCWGDGTRGQLGTGEITTCYVPTSGSTDDCPGPKPVAGNLRFVAIAAGSYHTCGLVATGELYCWGLNSSGQLGSSTGTPCHDSDYSYYGEYYNPIACALSPQLVTGAPAFTAVAAGVVATCGLSVAGSVTCYGPPDGTDVVSNSVPFASVSPDAICGIRVDGAAYCWNGGLDAQTASFGAPAPLAGGFAFSAITAMYRHRCGILQAGSVAVCWGNNEVGELGNGTRLSNGVPSPVIGLPNPQ